MCVCYAMCAGGQGLLVTIIVICTVNGYCHLPIKTSVKNSGIQSFRVQCQVSEHYYFCFTSGEAK